MSQRAEIQQDLETDGPGWARLVAAGTCPDVSEVRATFRRNSAPPYLGEADWGTSAVWHRLPIMGYADRLEITVPPALNEKLVNHPVEVQIEFEDGDAPRSFRLHWNVPVLAGAADATAEHGADEAVQHRTPNQGKPEAAPEPAEEQIVDEPIADDNAAAEHAETTPPLEASGAEADEHRASLWKKLVPVLLLLLVGGAVALLWPYFNDTLSASTKQAAADDLPDVACENVAIRDWLKNSPPSPADIRKLAAHCVQGEAADIGKKLYHRAARQKDPQAALTVARWLDPQTHEEEGRQVARPNAERAAGYYKVAADAGDPNAQFRYGELLYSGVTDDEMGPEQGVQYIRKAADAGHDRAARFLKKLDETQ